MSTKAEQPNTEQVHLAASGNSAACGDKAVEAPRIVDADLHDWLVERRDNALGISLTKFGVDREGWLEDADYFQRAIAAIARQA